MAQGNQRIREINVHLFLTSACLKLQNYEQTVDDSSITKGEIACYINVKMFDSFLLSNVLQGCENYNQQIHKAPKNPDAYWNTRLDW